MLSHRVAAVLLAAGLCAGVRAGLSQSLITAPGGFVQAGAAPSSPSGIPAPGEDMSEYFTRTGADFNEASFTNFGMAARSAASSTANLHNNAQGAAGLGYGVLKASNDAPNNAVGPRAIANGGWKETFTVSNPAYTGQAGYLQFSVKVSTVLKAAGFAGSATMRLYIYKNDVAVLTNPHFHAGSSTPLGTDRQYGNWNIATYSVNEIATLPVNSSVTFAVPITFGTPFTLGVYGWGHAGMRSQSGTPGNSTSMVENGEFRWGGILGVIVGSTPVGGSTVISGSGKDWGPEVQVPDECPADLNGDGVVDDADFVIFAVGYNVLDCADPAMAPGCPADLNEDGVVDDADFVQFAIAYNEFVCE